MCSIGNNTTSFSSSAFEFLSLFFIAKSIVFVPDTETTQNSQTSTQSIGQHFINENEIIISNSPYAVLLIDPYEKGVMWLTSNESVVTYTLSSERVHSLKNAVEECVNTGKPLLLKDMDYELHADVVVALKSLFRVEGMLTKAILFGKEVDVSPSFRLYICCRVHDPHFAAEYVARATVVDWSITSPALEHQLLTLLMESEKPELHRNRSMLLQEVSSSRARMAELNQILLKSLSQTEGYLLEDQTVINALINIKSAVQDADENLQKAKDAEFRINETYEAFRPVAAKARLLFGVLEEMRVFSRMYHFTLSDFISLFVRSVEVSEKTPSTSSRIASIISNLKTVVAKQFVRQYFDEHVPVFELLASFRILSNQDKGLTPEHLTYLIHGSNKHELSGAKGKDWIPDAAWLNCVYLSEHFHEFSSLTESVSKRDAWKSWWEKENPELEALPDFNHLDAFRRLMLFRALREDRLIPVLQLFTAEILGESYNSQRNVLSDLEEMCAGGHSATPLICIFRDGFDPAIFILNLAKRKHTTVEAVTLSKGHRNLITTMISKGILNGSWVVVQNAHMAVEVLTDIEIEMMRAASSGSSGFRLWVTTEPIETFPIGFLRISAKIVVQPAKGIRNLMHTLLSEPITEEILGSSDSRKWFKTFFTVCYTYCIIHERPNFGHVGFSLPYEFDVLDWSTSVAYMRDHVVDQDGKEDEVSSALLFVIGEVIFGGRVRSDWDRRVIDACIELFLSNDIHERQLDFLPHLHLPESSNMKDFFDMVMRMPATDSAERFGLSFGAELLLRTDQTHRFFQTFKLLVKLDNHATQYPPASPPQTIQKKEDYIATTIQELLSRVDVLRNLLKVASAPDQTKQEKQPGRRRLSSVELAPTSMNRTKFQAPLGSQKSIAAQPLLSFLYQEASALQNLISLVQTNLKELLSHVSSHNQIASDELLQILNSVHLSKIPSVWLKVSWPALNLSSWFSILQQRHDQLDKWVIAGKLKSYWLGGFQCPQGFISSFKLEISKKRGWALENVQFTTEISAKENEVYLHDGVILHGNFIEGASWSYREGRLADNLKKELIADFPKILLYFSMPNILSPESSLPTVQYKLHPWESRKEGYYYCPVYASRKRSSVSFLWAMPLRTEESSMKWILRGVAVICCRD